MNNEELKEDRKWAIVLGLFVLYVLYSIIPDYLVLFNS